MDCDDLSVGNIISSVTKMMYKRIDSKSHISEQHWSKTSMGRESKNGKKTEWIGIPPMKYKIKLKLLALSNHTEHK